ncbi:hypothetical protein ABT352_35535 [Streptosporangium sp. NPDC000563]|uniref:hypothetical protein n=1 Tax=unclassified Streptosporangium TaxID=2632669 RepID=UPI0033253D3F
MGFDFDGFIAGISWFQWAIFAIFGLMVLVRLVHESVEWWRDREWRKTRGLSDEDAREVLADRQARRVREEQQSSVYRHWRS